MGQPFEGQASVRLIYNKLMNSSNPGMTATTAITVDDPEKFDIDSMGRSLVHLHVDNENHKAIKELLPPNLRRFIRFTGKIWRLSYTKDLNSVPLFIANRPVLLPSPHYIPVAPVVTLRIPPDDPLPEVMLDPLLPLPEEAIIVAMEVFPDATQFLVFFDSSFVAVHRSDADCLSLIDHVPEKFGGLDVALLSNEDFGIIYGSESGNDLGAGTVADSPAFSFDADRTTPEGVNDAESDVSRPASADVRISPGNRLIIRGPLYGQERPEGLSHSQLTATHVLYEGSVASAGLIVAFSEEETYLTTVSHLPLIHYQKVRTARGVLGMPIGEDDRFHGDLDVYIPEQEEPVGKICKIFDPDAISSGACDSDMIYPAGYLHDIALIKPSVGIRLEQLQMFQFSIENKLGFNKLIRLLNPVSPFSGGEHTGRSFAQVSGATIGQHIAIINVHAQRSAASKKSAIQIKPHLEAQFSRSVLWRAYGDVRSLKGFSGSPLEVVDDKGKVGGRKAIIGFQNWEWGRTRPMEPWADDDKELEATEEDEALAAAMCGCYPFYGSYLLPSEIRGATICHASDWNLHQDLEHECLVAGQDVVI